MCPKHVIHYNSHFRYCLAVRDVNMMHLQHMATILATGETRFAIYIYIYIYIYISVKSRLMVQLTDLTQQKQCKLVLFLLSHIANINDNIKIDVGLLQWKTA